jgi:hypothetical protein
VQDSTFEQVQEQVESCTQISGKTVEPQAASLRTGKEQANPPPPIKGDGGLYCSERFQLPAMLLNSHDAAIDINA